MLTGPQRREIVGRSRTLSERLSTPAESVEETPEQVEEWVEAWRERFDDETWGARGDRAAVGERESARRLAEVSVEEPLPEWVDELTDLTADLAESGPHTVDGTWDRERPFVHLTVPVVEHASSRVDWPDSVAKSAVHGFEAALLDRLERLFVHPAFIDFKYHLLQHDIEQPDPRSDEEYRAFLDEQFSDGLSSFFHEYAFLARLTVTVIRQWVEIVEQFGERLAIDRVELGDAFGLELDARVVNVELLGDPHAGGRRVVGVTFDSGRRLAYKPRSVDPTAVFGSVLSWSNDAGVLPEFRPLQTLSRDGYGWVEWVDAKPCDSREGAERFYRRVGALTALLYALDFSDGHLENLVAAGEHPVIVDSETLAQPVVGLGEQTGVVAETVRDSVLSTGLIPRFIPDSPLRNAAGLDPGEAVDTDAEIAALERPNTDAMELYFREEETLDADHLPTVDGEIVRPKACRESLLGGFESGYRFLLSNRAELLADDGPLAGLADTPVRVLLRATREYGRVKRQVRESSALRTGVPFGLAAEGLAAPVVDDDDEWAVYRRERRALRRYDVPRFTVVGDETVLRHDGDTVAELPDVSPVERVRRRVRALSEADLSEQLDYLRLAFDSMSLSHAAAPTVPSVSAGRAETWTTERTPRLLFDRLTDATVSDGDDQSWLLRDYRETVSGRGAHVTTLADTLYWGRLGVALFGAGLAATTGESRYHEFVEETVAPIEMTLAGATPYPDTGIGGTSGVGALVYGFTKLAQLLERPHYLDHAERAAELFTDERIAADDSYDVVQGGAGGILGLLALHDETGSSAALGRARAVGDHLLSTAETVHPESGAETTGAVWSTIQSEPLCGVSHGVGGIAYALERLGRQTGEDRYITTARDAIRFENWAYDESAQNWPDRREGSDDPFARGWCTGRAGIGLTRLGLLRETADDIGAAVEHGESPLARDVRRALSGFDDRVLSDRDHPCCGNAGRVEFLTEVDRAGVDGDYEAQAKRLADAMTRRAERAGRFTAPWVTDQWTNPTFFAGDAGIGYTLLRLANPALPSVLLFE